KGSSLAMRSKEFTTENTEDHGGPRRFIGFGSRASPGTKESTTENAENHGGPRRFIGFGSRVSPGTVEPTSCRRDARSVERPASPWSSVVLGVLRGEFSPNQTTNSAHEAG